jgi:hypothetical protein
LKSVSFKIILNNFEKFPKHNTLHFEGAYLAHFPFNCSIFYRFGYARWMTTKLFKVSKGIDHG